MKCWDLGSHQFEPFVRPTIKMVAQAVLNMFGAPDGRWLKRFALFARRADLMGFL